MGQSCDGAEHRRTRAWEVQTHDDQLQEGYRCHWEMSILQWKDVFFAQCTQPPRQEPRNKKKRSNTKRQGRDWMHTPPGGYVHIHGVFFFWQHAKKRDAGHKHTYAPHKLNRSQARDNQTGKRGLMVVLQQGSFRAVSRSITCIYFRVLASIDGLAYDHCEDS